MASVFTIEAIEGNSHIGVPVFSRSAKMANYEYIVFSPPKGATLTQSTRTQANPKLQLNLHQ